MVKLRQSKTKSYKKMHHIDQVNKMLNGYIEQQELDDVDARLIIGIATKNPTIDSNQPPKPKVVMMQDPSPIKKSYGTGSSTNLVEMALGIKKSPEKPFNSSFRKGVKAIRVDSASSSGLNDRISQQGVSPRLSPHK